MPSVNKIFSVEKNLLFRYLRRLFSPLKYEVRYVKWTSFGNICTIINHIGESLNMVRILFSHFVERFFLFWSASNYISFSTVTKNFMGSLFYIQIIILFTSHLYAQHSLHIRNWILPELLIEEQNEFVPGTLQFSSDSEEPFSFNFYGGNPFKINVQYVHYLSIKLYPQVLSEKLVACSRKKSPPGCIYKNVDFLAQSFQFLDSHELQIAHQCIIRKIDSSFDQYQ